MKILKLKIKSCTDKKVCPFGEDAGGYSMILCHHTNPPTYRVLHGQDNFPKDCPLSDTELEDEDIKNSEQKIIAPRFCFICGRPVEEAGLGGLVCKNEECREMFLPYKDKEDGNQCLMHLPSEI